MIPDMTEKAIVAAASKLESTFDLLTLLNKIKEDELGDKAYPFKMDHLNYFINPKRNRASYRTFTIPKKSGGVRTISAPVKLLKSFLTYTNILLRAFYEAPDCVTGFVPAKSVVDNAEKHVGMNYVFNTDLKDFFPSISKSRVWATLKTRPFCFNDTVADAIAGLCCTYVNEKGEEDNIALPQGSPCSPILTNIVCHNLDWKLSGLARRFGLNYSRYADDITFSSMHNVYQEDGEFMAELRRIIDGQHFRINEKKTRLQKKGERQEVTGLVVSDRVNVVRDYVRDLDNLLYIWEKHGRAAAFAKFSGRYIPKQDLKAPAFDMDRVVAGRLAYLRMVKGEESPVWRRLQKRYNKLSGKKEKTVGTDIEYLNFYTIEKFSAATGLELHLAMETISVPRETPKEAGVIRIPAAYFMSGDRRINVYLSRYMQTRLRNILESGDGKALAEFKHKYIIAYCHSSTGYFWMIIRSMPKKAKSDAKVREIVDLSDLGADFDPADFFEPEEEFDPADVNPVFAAADISSQKEVKELVSEFGLTDDKSIDQILKKLVASNFDLKILDQWDKIKNS